MLQRWLVAAAMAMFAGAAHADEAYIRVVDVGGGLCVVAHMPDGQDLLYDAGHWQSSQCASAVAEIVEDDRLDVVIISHSDADHLGELPRILRAAAASVVIHGGYERRDTTRWPNAMNAIGAEVIDGASVINLATWPLAAGATIPFGEATLTFVTGWHAWDDGLSDNSAPPDDSELRNVISIVMRLEYAGQSILLTGDTVGRRRRDPDAACRDAERWMVGNTPELIDVDILIAPHHGGNNGSSVCFLEQVTPSFAIFSSGHAHGHPTTAAVERTLAAGVPRDHIFRTDFGDDEGEGEWSWGRVSGCSDPRGDDDVEIRLSDERGVAPIVNYRTSRSGCRRR